MTLKNASELLEKYPKIKPNKKGKLYNMGGDLIWYNDVGRIERVTDCSVMRYQKGSRIWFELDIKKSVLIDVGISVEEMKI